MTTQIDVLASLQALDQQLQLKRKEAEESEQRVQALEAAVRDKGQAAKTAREDLAGLTSRQRELEQRLATAEAKAKERRMRISRIRNEKELAAARRELDALKEESTQVEEELIGVLEQVEQAAATVRDLESELAKLSEALETEGRQLRQRVQELSGEIAREEAARVDLANSVESELRQKYEMIFSRRGGVAVVEIRDGTCQGCHMNVPPQLFNEIQKNQRVILCPSCQRMLFWRPQRDEAESHR